MYLTHTTNDAGKPVFVLVLPFEQKDLARASGFTWNNPQPGAWATDDVTVATRPIRQGYDVSVAPDTLDYIWQNTPMTDATYAKLKGSYEAPTKKEQAAIYAAILTDEQVRCVHEGLQYLAAVCDGAMADDRAGFNRNDLEFGHSMAGAEKLTRSQAGHGKNLLKKYRGQLGEELYASIFPELVEADRAAAEDKAQEKARKASAKLHKKGAPCDWKACVDSICMVNRFEQGSQPESVVAISGTEPLGYTTPDGEVVITQPERVAAIQLPASSVKPNLSEQITRMMGGGEPMTSTLVSVHQLHADGSKTDITDQPEKHCPEPPAELPQPVEADAEIKRLALSLATCFPGDFDTTVDLLRALREIDAPKKAGSDFTKAAWAASGYKTA